MKKDLINSLSAFAAACTNNEWSEIIAAANKATATRAALAKSGLDVGDKVHFYHHITGAYHQITITKICQKNIKGSELKANGRTTLWTCGPTSLKKGWLM